MNKIFSLRSFLVLLLQCNLLFAILNTGEFFELSSYWYFVLAVCSIGFLKIKKIAPSTRYERFIWFCLCWQVIVFLITLIVMGKVNTAYLFSYLLYFIFFYICLKIRFSSIEIKQILSSYMFSGVLVSGLIITLLIPYGDGNIRFSLQLFDNPMFDPNYLAAFLVFPGVITFSKMIFKLSLVNIILYGTFFLIIVIGLFLTGSRSAMIAVLIGSFFTYAHFFSKNLSLSKIIWSIAILYIVVIVVVFFLPEGTYARLFMESYNDGSNLKRLTNWNAGLEAFYRHPLFGYGYTSEMEAIKNAINKELVAHNSYIGLLIQFGVVGFTIYAVGISYLLVHLFKKKEYMLLGSVLSTLQLSLVVSAQVAVFFWFPIIAVVCIDNDMQYNEKNIREYL